MRNFKNTFVILLLLSLFSCNTQSISEDEIPRLEDRSAFGKEEPYQKSGFTMTISVMYPDGWDRNAVRTQIGPVLGLVNWSGCVSRTNVENWVVDLMTEADFFQLLANQNVVVRSVSSAGASDPYDKHDSKVVFIYGITCQ